MLRTIQDLHGFVVEATDGPIGRVVDCYFDDEAWTIRFLVVDTGEWLAGRKVLISPIRIGAPDRAGRTLPASVTRAQVQSSPAIDTAKPVSRQHEVEQYGYYGLPYYWGGPGLWGVGMPPAALRRFVQAQAEQHRRRGDDPHLRSGRAMTRYHVHATDGDIGHVDGLIVDDESWQIRYLIANTSDWWLGHRVLLAPQWIEDISWLEATVSVDLTRDAIKTSPPYDPDMLPDTEHEQRIDAHHRRTRQSRGGVGVEMP